MDSTNSRWQHQRHAQGQSTSHGVGNRPRGRFTAQSVREGNSRIEGRQERPGGVIFLQDQPGRVDARIRDDSDKAVVAKLSTDSRSGGTGANGLPLRPDFGTQGRAIPLRANFFPVNVRGRIYRYGVAITLPGDRKLTRRVKHRVFQLAEKTEEWQQARMNDRVAHDSAEKLVASIQLPQPLIIRGMYYDEDEDGPPAEGGSEYALTLTYEEEVDPQLLRQCLAGVPVDSQALAKVLSALNLVLTAHPSHTGIKIGRNDDQKKNPDQRLFFDNPEPKDIGGGLEVREGFYLSVRPAHRQLMVNVNTCHAAFYKPQNFVDAMDQYRGFTGKDGGNTAFGRQVRVTTKPGNRMVMIKGVCKRNSNEHKFKHKEFGLITVKEYYERKYSISLRHPGLPLLESADGNFYPQEVCDILSDQGFKGELTDGKHASNMLDVACKRPKENANEIVNRGLKSLGFRDSNPLLDSFGISVGTEMAVVPGRVLDKPGLSYSSGATVPIDNRASWNLRGVKFVVGARLDKWAVLVIQDGGRDDFRDTNDPVLRDITSGFRDMCNKSGMHVQPLKEQAYAVVRLRQSRDRFRDDAIVAIEQALKGLVARAAPELILIMLSNEDKGIYNGIKRLCDIDLDVATVCMQSSKVKRDKGRVQYYANVALKVNMKLGWY
ncbi:hypothetical protein JVU11DRAFT_8903 [Chiua virens]|nr:hypothetical protein JVU11DRAFT_8903 [Chiua virens]